MLLENKVKLKLDILDIPRKKEHFKATSMVI